MLIRPTIILKSVFDIDAQVLLKHNIKALLLDVDNTLAIHRTDLPVKGITEWIEKMKAAKIKLYILSNAKPKRLTRFANNVGLDFFYLSLKPLPFKINKAVKIIDVDKKSTAIVGDQLFTDVLAGKLAGVKTIWVDIFQPETSLSFKIKRKIEGFVRKRLELQVRKGVKFK